MSAIPSWAHVPLGIYTPLCEMRQKRVGRRPKNKCETPTPFESVILTAMYTHRGAIFMWQVADAIHATPQRRRDLHSYLAKIQKKGYCEIEDYSIGQRGPPRPLWRLTDKAREWLKTA